MNPHSFFDLSLWCIRFYFIIRFSLSNTPFVALFFLWRRERDSRLRRTRPGKQRVSAVWFAYRACGCLNLCANCSLPLASPPSNPSQYSVRSPQKKRALLPSFFVAEREGFEPPDSCPSTVFKTAAFDRSAISPKN